MEVIIFQNMYFPGVREAVQKEVNNYDTCQHTKGQQQKYGKLPDKLAEKTPWNKLCVDLMGL